jgi:outer membrane autotransporter protein
VLLTGRVGYENDDYEKIDRSDDRFDIGAGIRYSFTRNLYLGGSYTYSNRSSEGSAGGGGFSRNLFLLRLGAQL